MKKTLEIIKGMAITATIIAVCFVLCLVIGRLGSLTIATLWHFAKGERVNYPEGNIMIG